MVEADIKRVPNCLRKYRKAVGLKQRDVAQILDIKNTGMISRWEKGICLPSLLNTIKLAGIYCVLLDALFFPLVRKVKRKIVERHAYLKRRYG